MAGILQGAADAVRSRYGSFRESLGEGQQRLFDTFLFLAKFTVLALPLYAVLSSGWESQMMRSLNASISTVILSLAGLDVVNTGSVIYGDYLTLDVSWDSTGWKSMMAFTALVLATPAAVRRKLLGIVLGIVFLQTVNIARITSMFYAVEVFHVDYELLHTVLWRWGMTAMILSAWLLWLYSARIRTVALKIIPSRPI